MRRVKRSRHGPAIAFDSLVDVFMNAFAIAMFSSIALAISSDQSDHYQQRKPKQTQKSGQDKNLVLKLPATRKVTTEPYYIWLRADGVKVVNGAEKLEVLTTKRRYVGLKTLITPIPNKSTSKEDLVGFAKTIDVDKNHVILLVHPDGAGFFRPTRSIFESNGIASGWLVHTDENIVLSPQGESADEVQ